MSKIGLIRKLYIEAIVMAILFSLVATITLGGVYLTFGENVVILLDGESKSFESIDDMKFYINGSLTQNITIKNPVEPDKVLKIPLSSVGASYFSTYDMDFIVRKSDASLLQKVNAFFFDKKANFKIVVDSRKLYYNTDEIGEFIINNINALNYPSMNAKIIDDGNGLKITEEQSGIIFEPSELFEVIENGLREGNITNLEISAEPSIPEIKKANLEKYKVKKSLITAIFPEKYLRNSVAGTLLDKLNNTMIEGETSVELKKDFYAYLKNIVTDNELNKENEEYLYEVAAEIFLILKEACIEAGFSITEGDNKLELSIAPIEKDGIISCYLDGNQVKIIVAMVE